MGARRSVEAATRVVADENRSYSISGRVVELTSNRPIRGVQVRLVGQDGGTETDRAGRFFLGGLDRVSTSLRVDVPEGWLGVRVVREADWSDGHDSRHEFKLRRASSRRVAGFVLDVRTGERLSDVRVTIAKFSQEEDVWTDAFGEFETRSAFPEGRIRYAASIGNGPAPLLLGRGGFDHHPEVDEELRVEVERGPRFVVRLVGPRGDFVPEDWKVALGDPEDPEQAWRSRNTHASGGERPRELVVYPLQPAVPGPCTVEVRDVAGFWSGSTTRPAPPRTGDVVEVVLRELGVISGRVVDEAGEPVRAPLHLSPVGSLPSVEEAHARVFRFRGDAFEVKRVPGGTYDLRGRSTAEVVSPRQVSVAPGVRESIEVVVRDRLNRGLGRGR